MTIEEQVCSLELAKKLKELGVKQEAIFRYSFSTRNGDSDIFLAHIGIPLQKYTDIEYYAAYTVAELGEMLPKGIWSGKDSLGVTCWNQTVSCVPDDIEFTEKTEADSRAQMLIYLLENKLITL